MPIASVNGIEINYQLEGDGPETIVLVNGLADDLETWGSRWTTSSPPATACCASTTAASASRARPPGPYTSRLFADDAKALVDALGHHRLPPDGHVDGRDDRPGVRDRLRGRPQVGRPSLARTRRRARSARGCSRCGHDMAPGQRRPVHHARRDAVGVHACRSSRRARTSCREFEAAMAAHDRCRSTPTSRSCSSIQTHDTTDRLGRITRADARDRRRGGHPHPGRALAAAARGHPRAPSGRRRRVATPDLGAPGRSTRPSSSSSAPSLSRRTGPEEDR